MNLPSLVFVFVIPGNRRLPKFRVQVGSHGHYATCRSVNVYKKKDTIKVQCRRTMRGQSVKITTRATGRLSLCEVAVYGNYG